MFASRGADVCKLQQIGKGVKQPWPRPGQLALSEVLVENCFS